MRKPPFQPRPIPGGPYIRNAVDGTRWHRCSTRTLYADTDRSGVVYHANYLRYFEFGRASLMRDVGFPYREVEESGFVYPIVDMGLSFFRPLRYDDPMQVHTRPVDLERVRITFLYIITHGENEQIICSGHTRHCALNRQGRPTAVDPYTLAMWRFFEDHGPP